MATAMAVTSSTGDYFYGATLSSEGADSVEFKRKTGRFDEVPPICYECATVGWLRDNHDKLSMLAARIEADGIPGSTRVTYRASYSDLRNACDICIPHVGTYRSIGGDVYVQRFTKSS